MRGNGVKYGPHEQRQGKLTELLSWANSPAPLPPASGLWLRPKWESEEQAKRKSWTKTQKSGPEGAQGL